MAVKIRLRRTGKKNAACHRIVVADARSPRDGRFIENIGLYDPRHKNENVDLERVDYWVGNGAQMSDTVKAIVTRAREGRSLAPATPVVEETVAVKETPVVEETPVTEEASTEEEAPVTEETAE